MQILKTFRDNLIPIIYLDVIWVSHANFFVNTQHLNDDPENICWWSKKYPSQSKLIYYIETVQFHYTFGAKCKTYKTLKDMYIDEFNVCGGMIDLLKEYQNIVDLQNTSECVKRNQIYSSIKSRYTCAWTPCWNHGA